ncbi:hypothetical protein WR25_19093 [Diploscapter pachys]|uniref:ABC transporter domain-containing protein n=1 Tax=Diploscapter pachys TaxID=2018661 RepID=A0A2A2L0P7_9BILA|nr:hypothetical protein WR25_19093 [Diploscapter pachys]
MSVESSVSQKPINSKRSTKLSNESVVKFTEEIKTVAEEKSKLTEVSRPTPKKLVWCGIEATVAITTGGRKLARLKRENINKRPVINGVSGVARPGELLALMGSSGAGKTTLMNILARLKTEGVEYSGSVTVNGVEISQAEMRKISAYVQQIDLFCGTLTVREQLTYSAMMRMSSKFSWEEKMKTLEETIVDMNLTECENMLIGIKNKIRGIPFGEKKRLAFACEATKDLTHSGFRMSVFQILTNPEILFADEPTSGLDAFMATQVAMALRSIANKGKTVISVIHQPSSAIFKMFDKVCFMADGRVAYNGPVSRICEFFESFNDPYFRCPESYNPADFVITKVSIRPDRMEKDKARVEKIIAHYEQSEIGIAMRAEIEKVQSRVGDAPKKTKGYASSFLTQFWCLFLRSFKTTLRDPTLMKVRTAQVLITAVIIGLVNFRTTLSGATVQNVEGILYNCVRDMNFLFLFPSINAITSELPIFYREHKARIYSTPTYFLAKSVAELPQYTVLPIIYSAIVYWMTAYFGACTFEDEGTAVTYVPIMVLPMLVFGGFYVQARNIPIYYYPLWFKYGFESLQANHWHKIKNIPCKIGEICPAKNGYELLARRGMESASVLGWMTILFSFTVILRCLALGTLMFRVRFLK